MTLRSSQAIKNLMRLAICVRNLMRDVSADSPLGKRLLFEGVGVQRDWNEVLLRGFLGKQLPTVHLAILTLVI
jgi:hypothetical protein